MKVKKWES